MPYATETSAVLTDWREVQRQLQEVSAGTPEASRLHAEADRLRREYQSLVSKAAASFREQPAPERS